MHKNVFYLNMKYRHNTISLSVGFPLSRVKNGSRSTRITWNSFGEETCMLKKGNELNKGNFHEKGLDSVYFNQKSYYNFI